MFFNSVFEKELLILKVFSLKYILGTKVLIKSKYPLKVLLLKRPFLLPIYINKKDIVYFKGKCII